MRFRNAEETTAKRSSSSTLMGNSKFKIAAETMAEYDASQFHPRSLNCVLSLDGKQAQAVCALHILSGKTKV
jgi:hypothetical protein